MDDIDYGPYDVLTGHAGARFRWIDVRSDPNRESAPVQYTHYALPLERLLAGERLPYDGDTPLAVFGRGFDDTARAADFLERQGYRHVLPLSGERYGGYDWLVHSDLT